MTIMWGTRITVWLVAVAAAGCSSTTEIGDPMAAPSGPDVTEPFPIDRGDDANTPGTFKGLWLRLVDNGAPAVAPVDGVIGVVCIGMSNSNQECAAFIEHVRGPGAAEIDPAVRVVNCAKGGNAIERWTDPSNDQVLWDACLGRKLSEAGIRPDQVRVVYHKAANQFTTGPGGAPLPPYPLPGSDYERFLANLSLFATRVSQELPSVQAVYTTSRSYGGFAGHHARGEPLSYEEGHALNTWLGQNRTVEGVWYGWGPYIWAPDCVTGVTNASGMCYVRTDFVNDGVHPSPAGESKIALAIHQRFLQEAWYRR
jgi:hypothetical protein